MDFDSLIHPMSKKDFLDRLRAGGCFVIRGDPAKFEGLITLQEIEDKLNDGCNISDPVQVIQNGKRQALVDSPFAWSRFAVKKKEVLEHVRSGCSFMLTNMTQINPRVSGLIDGIEDALKDQGARADLHLYVSTTSDASAYNAHRDYPQHKIYLQVIGSTEWKIYSHDPELANDICAVKSENVDHTLKLVREFVLNPGDLFYMPPSVFHQIRNTGGPRVSFSIPVVMSSRHKQMDRTYIPFRSLFEAELGAAQSSSGSAA